MVGFGKDSPERGALQLGLVVALVLSCLLAFGTWGTFRYWRKTMETQLKIDRCVGEAALWAKTTLNRLETSNQAMKLLRIQLRVALATAQPEIAAPLQALLYADLAFQEGLRGLWLVKEALWTTGFACTAVGHVRGSFPGFPFSRPPPDELGPSPLEWPEGRTKSVRFDIVQGLLFFGSSRSSAAEVKPDASQNSIVSTVLGSKWTAAWTLPLRLPFRAGAH